MDEMEHQEVKHNVTQEEIMSTTSVVAQQAVSASLPSPPPRVALATSQTVGYQLSPDRVVKFPVKPKASSKCTHPVAQARLRKEERAREGKRSSNAGGRSHAARDDGPSTRKVLKFNKETGESSWVTEAVRPPISPRPKAKANAKSSHAKRRADERARAEAAASSLPRLEQVKVGTEVNGVVTNILDFGAFVSVGWKTDALLRKSEMALVSDCDPHAKFQVGQQISAWVIDVVEGGDNARSKLSLSLMSPRGKISLRDLVVGVLYYGEVTRVERYGLFVAFGATQDGLLHQSDICDKERAYAVGDWIDVEIVSVESAKGRISLRQVSPQNDATASSNSASSKSPAAASVAFPVPPRRRASASASSSSASVTTSYSLGSDIVSKSSSSATSDGVSIKESKSARRRRRRRAAINAAKEKQAK